MVARYPENMVATPNGATWFSVIDLSNALFAILLYNQSWYKFAFTFWNRQYTFTQLLQGYHNAPVICHKNVNQMWDSLYDHDLTNVILYVHILVTGTMEPDCLD